MLFLFFFASGCDIQRRENNIPNTNFVSTSQNCCIARCFASKEDFTHLPTDTFRQRVHLFCASGLVERCLLEARQHGHHFWQTFRPLPRQPFNHAPLRQSRASRGTHLPVNFVVAGSVRSSFFESFSAGGSASIQLEHEQRRWTLPQSTLHFTFPYYNYDPLKGTDHTLPSKNICFS